ncbi:Hypothetical predicted protein [Lecanosticta acicola]|uniref:Uncharacterized protein n=1 Tax=Lecanosticta acicola TaxID=111012 RepID=A0AAI8Z8H6_9PEZI|nr:Hypothetical predicted protein [Lecanosticta acicola]
MTTHKAASSAQLTDHRRCNSSTAPPPITPLSTPHSKVPISPLPPINRHFGSESNASHRGHYPSWPTQSRSAANKEAAKDHGDSVVEGSQCRPSYPTVAPVPRFVDLFEHHPVDAEDWIMQAPGKEPALRFVNPSKHYTVDDEDWIMQAPGKEPALRFVNPSKHRNVDDADWIMQAPGEEPALRFVNPLKHRNVDDADWIMQAPGRDAFSPPTVVAEYSSQPPHDYLAASEKAVQDTESPMNGTQRRLSVASLSCHVDTTGCRPLRRL